jgi:hypothetical protein
MMRLPALLLISATIMPACSSEGSAPDNGGMTASVTDSGTVAGFIGVTSGTNGTSAATDGAATMSVGGNATTSAPSGGSMAVTSTSSGAVSSGNANSSAGFTSGGGAGGSTGNAVTTGMTRTTGTTGGDGMSPHDVFGSCRFHFGAIDRFARDNPSIRAELDFFTPGWMGLRDTFDQSYVCDDTEPGGPLEGLVPVVVAYVAAFYAKRHNGLNDCNVGSPDLCTHGASFIKQNLSSILDVYRSYAQGYAQCYGTTRPIVFEMEPDYYQYTYDTQTDPMAPAEAGSIMSQFVGVIGEHLPNAVFSMDISPWVAPNNGSDHGASWYSNFDMSLFTFVHTSGGSTDATSATIRGSNNMTWAGVGAASGKSVLADTGYGVNGSSEGHDSNWDNPNYINQRIADGVISISQYNPNSNWGATIAQIRSQLDAPAGCR